MFERKRKHKLLKLSALLIFSASLGILIGYASVRYKSFPFYEKLNQTKESTIDNETIIIPSPEPIYTNVTENNTIENSVPEEAPMPVPSFNYLVKTDMGKVYLFEIDDSGNLLKKEYLPINLNALKDEDKKLFDSGIPVKNKQELASVLEDFGS